MDDDEPDSQPPCHNLTVRECKVIHNIDKIIEKYEQVHELIRQLENIINNNDYYFVIHRQQILDDVNAGRQQPETYVETLVLDSSRQIHELTLIRSLLNRAITANPMRIIKYESDSQGGADQ